MKIAGCHIYRKNTIKPNMPHNPTETTYERSVLETHTAAGVGVVPGTTLFSGDDSSVGLDSGQDVEVVQPPSHGTTVTIGCAVCSSSHGVEVGISVGVDL